MKPLDWMNIEFCAFKRADEAGYAGDTARQLREARSGWMASNLVEAAADAMAPEVLYRVEVCTGKGGQREWGQFAIARNESGLPRFCGIELADVLPYTGAKKLMADARRICGGSMALKAVYGGMG